MMRLQCTMVIVAIITMVVNGAINPTPETYSLPNPGIRSVALARNTTTLVVATYSQAYALFTPYTGGPMTLISKTDYWPGDFQCLLVGEGQFEVGVVTTSPSNFSHPINYLLYHFQEPAGTFVLDTTTTYDVDNYDLTCQYDSSERNQRSGFYMATNTPTLYFLSRYTSPITLTKVGGLTGIATGRVNDLVIIPGTNSSQYMPTTMIVTTPQPETTAVVAQYALPTPAAPSRTRVLAADEIGAQYVNLFEDYQTHSVGWLITTLKNKGGVRLQPYDFGGFKPLSGAAIVDTQTVRGAYPQQILVSRKDYCVYIVGAHPSSTQSQPVVTLTQWYSKTAAATPQKIDQVVLKLKSTSSNGIISMRAGWMGFVYLVDDQNVYRFTSKCPDSF